MRRRQVAEVVLQLVQVLDQQVTLARRITEQLPHLGQRLVRGLAPLGTLALHDSYLDVHGTYALRVPSGTRDAQ